MILNPLPVYVLVHENTTGEEFDLNVYGTREGAAAAAERKALAIASTRGLPDPSVWWSSPLHGELQAGRRLAGEHFYIEPRQLEDGQLIPQH